MDLSPQQWALATLAALFVGLSKSGFAGLGILPVLLMAAVFPPRESTGALLPMLLTADLCAISFFHRHARGRVIARLLPPALAGIVAGYLLMDRIPAAHFARLLGGLLLALCALQLAAKLRPRLLAGVPHTRPFAWISGFAAGVTTMLANAAGPIMNLYLLAIGLPKMQFVGTAAWFFLTVNVCKVPFSAHLGLISGHSLLVNLALAPVIALSVFTGQRLLHLLPQKLFELLVLLSACAAALRLLLS